MRALLREVEDVHVVGDATDGDQAIAQAERLAPDVILMDLRMPGTNGIEATRHILVRNPHIGIVVLTMFDDDESGL